MTEEDQEGNAAAKVQEAAENVQQVTKRRRRITGNQAEQVSRICACSRTREDTCVCIVRRDCNRTTVDCTSSADCGGNLSCVEGCCDVREGLARWQCFEPCPV